MRLFTLSDTAGFDGAKGTNLLLGAPFDALLGVVSGTPENPTTISADQLTAIANAVWSRPERIITGVDVYVLEQFVNDDTGFDEASLGSVAWLSRGNVSVFGQSLYPVTSSVSDVVIPASIGGVDKPLTVFQNTKNVFSWKIVDGDGNPYDLTGHEFQFVVHRKDKDDIVFSLDNDEIVLVEGDATDNPDVYDTIVVTIMSSKIAGMLAKYEYKLRNLTLEMVHGSGDFMVRRAPLIS